MVCSDTSLSKHYCQQMPGVRFKLTQMMDEIIKEIHSMQLHRMDIDRYRTERCMDRIDG